LAICVYFIPFNFKQPKQRRMKNKFVIVSLLSILTMGSSFAQISNPPAMGNEKGQRPPLKPEEKAIKEATRAEKELGLSSEQKLKWQEAALIRIKANQPLAEKMKGSTTPEERKQIKSEMKTNAQTFDAKVNSMLSTSQQEKWKSMKESKKAEMHKKGKAKKEEIEEEY